MKKYLLILLAPLFLFLTSCVNSVEEPTYNPGSVTIEQNTFRQISKTVEGEESLASIPIQLNFSLNSKNIDSISTTIGEIGKETLELKNIPFGKGLILSLDVLYKGNSIYKGESKAFELSQENMNPKVELDLSPVSYTITYKLSEGIDKLDSPIIKTSSYTFDSLITLPKAISNGKNFKGWSVDGNSVKTLGRENTFGNVTLYPIWDIIEYSVTFMNNSEIVRAMKVHPGYTLTKEDLIPLTKNGYNFKGWHLFQDKVYPDTFIVRDNIILNALWLEKGYVEDVKFYPPLTDNSNTVYIHNNDHIYLDCDTSSASIYYSLDGTEPQINEKNLYKESIPFSGNAIQIRAVAVKDGLKNSKVSTSAIYKLKTYNVSFLDEKNTEIKSLPNLRKGYKFTKEDLAGIEPTDNIHEFVTWQCNGNNVLPGLEVTSDLTLTPLFKLKDETSPVTFEALGTSLDYNSEIKLSCETPNSKIYYTTDGTSPLYKNGSRKLYTTPIKLTNDSVTIIAIAEADGLKTSKTSSNTYFMKKYRIIFDNNGKGNVTSSFATLKKDSTITLETLQEPGYDFLGWEDSKNKVVDETYKVYEDTVVKAKWNPITYTINYYNNGVATSEPNNTIETDILLADPSPRVGYKFMGWYKTPEFKEGTKVTRIANTFQDVHLYAKWDIVTYTIKYIGAVVPDGKYTYSETEFQLPTPTRIGYKFDGWCTDEKCVTTPIKNLEAKKTGPLILYAKWTDDKTVSSVTFSSSDSEFNKGSEITLSTTTNPATIYYTLDESDPTNSETRIQYTTPIILDKDKLIIKAYAESGNLKPSAVSSTTIIMKKYTVFFNTQFGSVGNQKIAKGDKIKKIVDLSETGYTFGGWFKDDAHKTSWNFDTDTVETSNIVLHAKWIPNTYTIIFDANRVGGITTSTENYNSESTFAIPINDLSRTGYSFSYTSSIDGTGDKYSEGTIYKIKDIVQDGKFNEQNELTLYAQYKPITYQVYLDSDPYTEDSNPTYETYSYEQNIILPLDVTKSGYRFDYLWKNTANGKTYRAGDTVKNLASKQDEQITLTAQFTNTAPSPVSNVKAVSHDTSVTLTWTDPVETDVSRIRISYTPDAPTSPIEVAKGVQTATISNLKNKTLYTFTLTAVDDNSVPLSSTSVTVKSFANPLQTLTESLVELSSGTEGTIGTSGKYVLYGDWPQTLKDDNVDIVSTEPISLNNGLQCYLGNDNNYYVKVAKAKVYNNSKDIKFNDDKTFIVPDSTYYFKVEPIKWRVLSDTYDTNNKLLLAESILDGKVFDSSLLDFKDSSIKTYLNSDFYEKAFSATAKNKIIPNPLIDGTDNNAFLISFEDIQNTTYSFQNHVLSDPARSRRASDFARVKGLMVYEGTEGFSDKDYSVWWTSSKDDRPGYPGTIVTIGGDGSLGGAKESKPNNESYGGVVPAIVYGTPKINSFSLPVVGTLKANTPITFRVDGQGLSKTSIKVTGDSVLSQSATTKVISDKLIEVTTTIPQTAGNYNISVGIGNGQTQSSKLIVRDTASLRQDPYVLSTGDIITTDGFISAKESAQYHKDDAAGIVFISQYGAVYAVGLKVSPLQTWSKSGTQGDTTKFDNIISTPSKNGTGVSSSVVFTGDFNGSDNWEYIKSIDSSAEANVATNYPAFNYSLNYGKEMALPLNTGWYIPSIYELNELCKVKNEVNATIDTLKTAGLTTIKNLNECYWSSSQTQDYSKDVWSCNFADNTIDYSSTDHNGKASTKYTLCIRELGPFTPELTSISFPKVGLKYCKDAQTSGKTSASVWGEIKGKNLDPTKNYSITSSDFSIKGISKSGRNSTCLRFAIEIPTSIAAGTYNITVNYEGKDINGSITITDYQTLNKGDVLLNDGTFVSNTTITPEQKNQAVGLFYGQYSGYGVPLILGLKESAKKLSWTRKISKQFNVQQIMSMESKSSQDPSTIEIFSGTDNDGSDNWGIICEYYPFYAANPQNNYEGFNYALTYANDSPNLTGEYSTDWYIPSYAELIYLYREVKKDTIINDTLSMLNAMPIGQQVGDASYYMSSTQGSSSTPVTAGIVKFADNGLCKLAPLSGYLGIVRPIRQF